MALNEVYIIKTANFFPNKAVSNDEMEEYLGYINNAPSKSKKIVLRNNGIKQRYYALEKGGKITHTNAQMTALAIKALFGENEKLLSSVELLSCGTSTPDQMMPSHGVMVHGELKQSRSIEVVSPSGVCCAGMHALKYAFMAVKTGDVSRAVATGSERFSGALRSEVFEDEAKKLVQLEDNPYISFEKEFLRWMLSDGASAFLLSDQPNETGISLRVDWLEGVSYANIMEACMYMGCEKLEDGSVKSYMEYSPEEIMTKSIFSIKQDVKLLGEYIIQLGGKTLLRLAKEKNLDLAQVDYFLPHISSEFFRSKIVDFFEQQNIPLPYNKWLVNLSTLGNVGAASVYFMVDEIFKSGRLKKGQKILLMVPESARFSYVYGLLTVC